jgi:thioredoxin reductase (NADPH)
LPAWQTILPNRAARVTLEGMWDCIVIGGGAAGLSAALVLGRARYRVLVLDANGQSNRASHGIGGLLGHDQRKPDEFYAHAHRELAKYPSVELRQTTALKAEPGFTVDGEQASTLLLAPGMDYRFADVPGLRERWGGSVFHCPFCHGWEHRDEPLGVLGGEPLRARLLTNWSDDVTYYGETDERLAGVKVEPRPVIEVRDRELVLEGGEVRACGGLLLPVTLHQRTDVAQQLGVRLREPGMLAVDAIATDEMARTSVAGVFAAGDVTGDMPSVANAIAAGSRAAAAIVHDRL